MTEEPGRPLTIGMVAGEASGDNLGAPLVRQLQRLAPGSQFVGIGGPNMAAEGFESLADMERLNVNGFVDPLMRLPDLWSLLTDIRDQVIASKADCFVGVDFNFFNLLLEGMLKKRGIRTVHYVSPTVWAWRQGRIRKIKRNVDLMLTLYPFETEIYEKHDIPVAFVGHPKALEIGMKQGRSGQNDARTSLGIATTGKVIAMLPGSRSREVEMTGRDFFATAELLNDQVSTFVVPAANSKRRQQIESLLAEYPGIQPKTLILDGDAQLAMTASDFVMANGGTATLEAMLLKKPMLMSYRVGKTTYAIVSRLLKIEQYSLPNILSGKSLIPEFVQDDATPEAMAAAALQWLEPEVEHVSSATLHQSVNAMKTARLLDSFDNIHRLLSQSHEPGLEAARQIVQLCK